MTPKRADATCLIALRRQSPLASGSNRDGSSPPSPVFDRARSGSSRSRAARAPPCSATRATSRRSRSGGRCRAPARPHPAALAPSPRGARTGREGSSAGATRRRRARRSAGTPPRRSDFTACCSAPIDLRVPLMLLALASPAILAAVLEGRRVIRTSGKARSWRAIASAAMTSIPMPPIRDGCSGNSGRRRYGRCRGTRRSARCSTTGSSRCPCARWSCAAL